MPEKIAVIGECMIEIKPFSDGKYLGPSMKAKVCYGGDTLNFSVYMAREGCAVDYVTAVGDDPMSDWMLSQWRDEGIGCDLVERLPGAVPGLYLIDIDETGERSFYYWRDQSPARRIFDEPRRAEALCDSLQQFSYIYLSGITLALYSSSVREGLYRFLDGYRAAGGQVLFDNNYRPRQWNSLSEAQFAFEQMYRRCDTALPTIDDELQLFGAATVTEIIARLRSWGVKEVVVKQGADGCTVAAGSDIEHVAATPVEKVVDTTAAGDSFNAGYLAARLSGKDAREAARRGTALAAKVVQHPGAIIPRQLA